MTTREKKKGGKCSKCDFNAANTTELRKHLRTVHKLRKAARKVGSQKNNSNFTTCTVRLTFHPYLFDILLRFVLTC
jgi:hypothetical protein